MQPRAAKPSQCIATASQAAIQCLPAFDASASAPSDLVSIYRQLSSSLTPCALALLKCRLHIPLQTFSIELYVTAQIDSDQLLPKFSSVYSTYTGSALKRAVRSYPQQIAGSNTVSTDEIGSSCRSLLRAGHASTICSHEPSAQRPRT